MRIWEQEYKKLNQQNEEILTIQEVEVTITNGKIYSLDQLSVAEAEDVIEDDLSLPSRQGCRKRI